MPTAPPPTVRGVLTCRPAPAMLRSPLQAEAALLPALDATAALALLEFKAQLPGWGTLVPARAANLTGWRQEESASSGACSWTFVSCDESGRVSTL